MAVQATLMYSLLSNKQRSIYDLYKQSHLNGSNILLSKLPQATYVFLEHSSINDTIMITMMMVFWRYIWQRKWNPAQSMLVSTVYTDEIKLNVKQLVNIYESKDKTTSLSTVKELQMYSRMNKNGLLLSSFF